MDVKFTTKSQEALSAAAMNASTAGNPQLEPAHLLKALMDQREGVAVALLRATGADPDAVSVQASSAIKALPSSSGSSVQQAQLPALRCRPSRPPRTRPRNSAIPSCPLSTSSWGSLPVATPWGSYCATPAPPTKRSSPPCRVSAVTGKLPRKTRKTPSRRLRNTARTSPPSRAPASWIP
ncbi:chaperone protein ClpB [Arthrobacter sp. Hiyo1]|nr:chaperone protein ClpB [Arthrobacter sp. Hiyo1]